VTLRRLRDPAAYDELEAKGARLEAGLREAAGDEVRVQRVGSMLTAFFHPGPVRNFEDAQAADSERYGAFFRHMLASGVYLAPSQFEAAFVSLAHGDAEIERTVEAAKEFFGS
jgi:glutamate-1-semialdehyde 2,1-aminomutase